MALTVLWLAGVVAAHTEVGLMALQQLSLHPSWLPAAAIVLAARRAWIRSRRLLTDTHQHWLSALPIPPRTQRWVLGLRNLGDFAVYALLGSTFLALAAIPDLHRFPLPGLLWAWFSGALATAMSTTLAPRGRTETPAEKSVGTRHDLHEKQFTPTPGHKPLPDSSLGLIGIWQRRRIRTHGLQRRTRILLLVVGLSLPMGTPLGIGVAFLLLGLALGRFMETITAAATVSAEATSLLSLQPVSIRHLRRAVLRLPMQHACAYAILFAALLALIGVPLIFAILIALLCPSVMWGILTMQARISG